MDLITIGRTLAKHKILTALVAVLTLGGLAFVVFAIPPTYQSSASMLLVQPPAPPTREDIEEDPSLADINTDNPYLRAGGVFPIVELMTRRGNEPEVQDAFSGEGVSFEVAPSVSYSNVSPFIDVIVTAPSPTQAVLTAQEVMDFLSSDLEDVQAAQEVDPKFMITTLPVDTNLTAESQISGKLRALVAVVGLGVVMLFVVMTFATAWDAYQAERPPRNRRRRDGRAGTRDNSSRRYQAPGPGDNDDARNISRPTQGEYSYR